MASTHASPPRVTELPNALTADIDIATSLGAVRLLGASDAGLFTGWGGLPGISSAEMISASGYLVRSIDRALRHPAGRVVISGCGTSGRLAHLISRGLNSWLERASIPFAGRFDYLIAGSDAALLLPQESAEDQFDSGRNDLEAWARATGVDADAPVVVIGVSCGLSATYVASMLHAALRRPGWVAVAIGFNPIEAIKSVRVDGWAGSFHSVLMDMLSAGPTRAIILNPIVGPESIAGSSRMKGGSATKILLETACCLGVYAAVGAVDISDDSVLADLLRHGYAEFEAAVRCVYNQAESISRLVDAAAASLLAVRVSSTAPAAPSTTAPPHFVAPTGHGRVLYVGVGTPGLLGIVDASECYPTYGSRFNDVHGFVAGGWATMKNKSGPIEGLTVPAHLRGDKGLESFVIPQAVSLDLEAFDRDYLPTLDARDTIILVAAQEASDAHAWRAGIGAALRSIEAAKAAGAQVAHILALLRPDSSTTPAHSPSEAELCAAVAAVSSLGVVIRLPAVQLLWDLGPSFDCSSEVMSASPSVVAELAIKLVLNSVTTGAHIHRGAIYSNRMVNVGVTNAKLFHRAVGIVREVAGGGCSLADATTALLRAIYHVDPETKPKRFPAGAPSLDALHALPVSSHVAAAASQLDLVPVAVLLAAAGRGGRGLSECAAAAQLQADPILRRALRAALSE